MCRVLAGIVVHVATFSRPDVAFAAQFTSSVPSSYARLRLLRRVLGYLARTAELRITYGCTLGLRRRGGWTSRSVGYRSSSRCVPVDADHAVDRSTTGWVILLGLAAVLWAVRAQVQPSISSTESELYGLSTAVCDLLACINVAEELWGTSSRAPFLFSATAGALGSSWRTRRRRRALGTSIGDGTLCVTTRPRAPSLSARSRVQRTRPTSLPRPWAARPSRTIALWS